MNFSKLEQYQGDVVKLLSNSFKKNRLVHTYLFYGPKGTLKKEAAFYLASLILCKNGGNCGECTECKSIIKESNPHVFMITADGQTIKKEQILALEHEFSMASSISRVFIIEHIDKASAASANSLLKFLEEANENNYGILITENLNMVIPTIRSRSQIVVFKTINRKIIYQELISRNVKKELAEVISTQTNNIEEAINFTQDKTFLDIVKFVILIGMSFEKENSNPFIILREQGKFLFNEKIEYHNIFLNLLIILQSDKIKFLIDNTNDIVYEDIIHNGQLSLNQETQINILEIMVALKSRMRYNLNMELAYFGMLIEIVRCING